MTGHTKKNSVRSRSRKHNASSKHRSRASGSRRAGRTRTTAPFNSRSKVNQRKSRKASGSRRLYGGLSNIIKYGGVGLVGTVAGMVGSRIYHSKDIEFAQMVRQHNRLNATLIAKQSAGNYNTKNLEAQIDALDNKITEKISGMS